jgi:glycosyltransferase involved in cell wall biosynthesis
MRGTSLSSSTGFAIAGCAAMKMQDIAVAATSAGETGCKPAGAARPMIMHARVVTGSGGGPDKTILNSPRFLDERGFDCVCMFLRPPEDQWFDALRQRAARWRAPIIEVDDRGPWNARIVERMSELCDEHSVAVWHAHDYKTNLLGLLLRRRRPMRLVTTCHGWVERSWRTAVYHQFDRFTLRRFDHVIAVSADIAGRCRDFGVPDTRLSLIENAIDVGQYARTRTVAEAKKSLGWPADRAVVGAVGRLSAEKGFDLLIRAMARLASEGRDVDLVIAGDGPQRQPLEQLAKDLGIGDRVRLLGFQSDLIPIYQALDAYALSSLREGLAAAGRKTIADRYSFDRRMDKIAAVYEAVLEGANYASHGT